MLTLSSPLALLAALALAATPLLPRAADDPSPQWGVHTATAAGIDDRQAFDYQIGPGVEIRDFVSVSNTGQTPATFTVYATDAINDFESGAFSLLPADKPPTDVGSWITLDVPQVTLEPGTQAVVPFKITVPSDASPGDHAAGIVASFTKAGDSGSAQAVALDQRVGTRVTMNISGAASASVETAGLVASYDSPWNPFAGGTLHLDYAVRNTGNLRANVDQAATITGPFGIGLGAVAPTAITNLLPGQSVHVTADLAGVPPLFALWTDITLQPSPTIGDTPQTAGLSIVPTTVSTMAAAIPYTLLLLIVLLAIGVLMVVRYLSVTRDRFYGALDDAAEEARAEGRRDAEAGTLARREAGPHEGAADPAPVSVA